MSTRTPVESAQTSSENPHASKQFKQSQNNDQQPANAAQALSIGQFPTVISRNLILSIIATGIMAFVGILTETMTNVLFPVLMEQFAVSTATVQWLTTGYLLMVAVVIPVSSYCNRRFTNRTTFIIAMVLCIAGLALAPISMNFAMLMLARLLQGAGTGLALPLMFNIVLEQSPRRSLGLLMGFASMVCAIAPALGPTVGGVAAEYMNWHWIFALLIPFMVVAFVLGIRTIETHHPVHRLPFPLVQLAFLAISFVAFVFALDRMGTLIRARLASDDVTQQARLLGGLVVLCIVAMAVYVHLSGRSAQPLLQLDVLRDIPFRWHLVAYVLLETVTIGMSYLITNMSQLGYGTSSMTAGLLILPSALLGAALGPVGGALLDRFGAARPIMIAMAFALLGLLIMLFIPANVNIWIRVIGYIVYMCGFTMSFANTMTAGLAAIAPTLHADGNAMFNTLQQLGGAVGTTVMALCLSIAQSGHGEVGSRDYMEATKQGGEWALIVVSVFVFVAILANLRAFFNDRRQHVRMR